MLSIMMALPGRDWPERLGGSLVSDIPQLQWAAAVIYSDMADGQVVLVTTHPLEGGPPIRSVYFVAEQDPEKAAAIIAAVMAPNEKVEAWGRLPEAAVKALGLKHSDFTHG